ncbi:MAG: HAMP domain-containing histidine kinase [Thermoanaerobaculaceae bacterium]|jgi:two-component system OmpR family sensor kinase|nr:HAMP domain-containing histidine kinase [Thermoanaerobaculaceae bacterium]
MSMERVPTCELPDLVIRLGHQIRNPLATIQSGIQLVQVLTQPAGEVAECLASALGEVARIETMLRDAQRLVRLTVEAAVPVMLAEAARRAADTLQRSAPTKPDVNLDGPPQLRVNTDPELLHAALGELLARAAHVTPAGRTVYLRWSEHGTDRAALEVEDPGPCPPSGDPERALRGLMATWPGSGLGLCLAERACTLLGGHLDWSRLDPQGCCFRITLPRG